VENYLCVRTGRKSRGAFITRDAKRKETLRSRVLNGGKRRDRCRPSFHLYGIVEIRGEKGESSYDGAVPGERRVCVG